MWFLSGSRGLGWEPFKEAAAAVLVSAGGQWHWERGGI